MERKYCPKINILESLENPFEGNQCMNPNKCSSGGCRRLIEMFKWVVWYNNHGTIIPSQDFDARPKDTPE